MKQIVIKITDAFYEKVMRYEVNAPIQLIEAVRQGKEMRHGKANSVQTADKH